MKPARFRSARLALVAVSLVAGLLAYQDAGRSAAGLVVASTSQQLPSERSIQASEVEAIISRTRLVAKLRAAMGGAYGGVWFEPSTAQLHVGVTSSASRRGAEAVAARAGLADALTETPVRSTWAQLEAAQERWDHRLADLLGRGDVTTSPAPDLNSVRVRLSASVSEERRAALEREAAVEEVEVSITVEPTSNLGASPIAKCNKHKKFEAFCNPTLVSGVTITGELFGEERNQCTAGPAVILEEPATAAEATETYVLTAGHCIDDEEDGGGVGADWNAYNKEGVEKEIGPAAAFLNAETDVGVVKLDADPSYWAEEAKPNPVVPHVANWTSEEESDPFVAEGVGIPAKETKTCFSGQRSGTKCGTILETGVTKSIGGVEVKNLVEVDLGKVNKAGKGDSGSPFYSEAAVGTIEGTAVAAQTEGGTGEGRYVWFQPLEVSFGKLKAEREIDLKLLTTQNEKRHGRFKAGKYPATIHASTTTPQKFSFEAGSVECKNSTFRAVLSEASSTLTVAPEYKECTGLESAAATINMEGCTYVFHVNEKVSPDNYRAGMDISCPAGKSMKINAGNCKVEIGAQSGLKTLDLVDDTGASPKKDITMRPTITGIAYSVTEDGCFCPFSGTGAKTGGAYSSTANVTFTAENPSEAAEKIDIEVADE